MSEKEERASYKQATSVEKLSEFLEGYRIYASVLRNWIAGFSAGVPAFLALNNDAWTRVLSSPLCIWIAIALFISAASQIAGAALFKHVNSLGYLVDVRSVNADGLRGKFARYCSNRVWPDLTLDIVGISTSFAAAALLLYVLVIKK